jgi:predicted  nucleic acid-binding Zn-ribbon protein
MRETMAALSELQELELVLAESAIIHPPSGQDKRREDLQAQCLQVRQTVPEEILKRYDQLRRRGMAVSHEVGGICSCCHLRVPLGDLQRMRNGKMPWVCPNCGLFVLLDHDN